jgi:hypothetical protein
LEEIHQKLPGWFAPAALLNRHNYCPIPPDFQLFHLPPFHLIPTSFITTIACFSRSVLIRYPAVDNLSHPRQPSCWQPLALPPTYDQASLFRRTHAVNLSILHRSRRRRPSIQLTSRSQPCNFVFNQLEVAYFESPYPPRNKSRRWRRYHRSRIWHRHETRDRLSELWSHLSEN